MAQEASGQALIGLVKFIDEDGGGVTGLTDILTSSWRVTTNGSTLSKTQVLNGASMATAAMLEIGEGLYGYPIPAASNSAAGQYVYNFTTADADVVNKSEAATWTIQPSWVDTLAAILAKTNTIGTGTATVVSPNHTNGNFETEIADDYTVNSGRILPSNTTDWWAVLDLPNAQSITYSSTPRSGGNTVTVSLDLEEDVVSPTQIQIQFTRDLFVGHHRGVLAFKVVAVLNADTHGGDHVTIWEGEHTLT
jgi:hypothetical protein